MGKEYGKYAAGGLAEAFYERMLGVGQSLEARGDMPETAEDFANVVTHVVFDSLGGALMLLNEKTPPE